MRKRILAATMSAVSGLGLSQQAQAYDIDCAIMLCMAGGFPPGAVCARAYRTMIRRITPWPSLPPFGVCTFAAAPVQLGGTGGMSEIDTSSPEYNWLNRTRVIWWHMSRVGEREGGVSYSWTIKSCDGENEHCRDLESVFFSGIPRGTFITENGQDVLRPTTHSRGVMIEFGDYEGNMSKSEWFFY